MVLISVLNNHLKQVEKLHHNVQENHIQKYVLNDDEESKNLYFINKIVIFVFCILLKVLKKRINDPICMNIFSKNLVLIWIKIF